MTGFLEASCRLPDRSGRGDDLRQSHGERVLRARWSVGCRFCDDRRDQARERTRRSSDVSGPVGFFAGAVAAYSIHRVKLDAIPDLSDPQVIIFTEWMGRSPTLVEDQVTYPIVTSMLAATPLAMLLPIRGRAESARVPSVHMYVGKAKCQVDTAPATDWALKSVSTYTPARENTMLLTFVVPAVTWVVALTVVTPPTVAVSPGALMHTWTV